MSPIATTEWVPERLGRYDIIGELATGGMAQILLAKPSEPGGFKRLVVLKRILPHLADDKAFIQMFHDEARIVGTLDHPNVVQVHELEEGSDGMFMVMEFLDGESMFGLMRRLTRLKTQISHDLAIHLVAEACSGLHAAHEMRDDQDRPLDLVHRDISPHNLFVTYSGKLKVIDFGIAKTENRITRTETGQLKGKFEYMSPEQCAAQPVDRRADVYALGIVLYELVTGRRLFKRANELLTIRAVTEQPIIPPSELNPDCSPELEAVTMRALAREPEDRFESCAKMRRALLRVLREEHRSPKLPEDQLLELMQELFPDRIDEKKKVFERIQEGSAPTKLPRPEVDLQYAVPEISDDELRAHTHTRNVDATVNKRIKPRTGSGPHGPDTGAGRSPTPGSTSSPGMPAVTPSPGSSPGVHAPSPPAGGARPISSPGMPAVGDRSAPGVAAPAPPGAPPLPPVPRAQSSKSRTAPKVSKRSHIASGVGVFCAVLAIGIVVLMMLDESGSGVVHVPERTDKPVEPKAVPVAGAASTHVKVRIQSTPQGATVLLNGKDVGTTPTEIAVPHGGTQHAWVLELDGYEAHTGTLVPFSDQQFHATLTKLSAPDNAPVSKAQQERRAARRARREARRLEREGVQPPAPPPPPPPKRTFPKPKPKKSDPFRRFD